MMMMMMMMIGSSSDRPGAERERQGSDRCLPNDPRRQQHDDDGQHGAQTDYLQHRLPQKAYHTGTYPRVGSLLLLAGHRLAKK